MATIYHNLSDYNVEQMPTKEIVAKQHYAIAVADWNPNITHALLNGAYDALIENGAKKENIIAVHVPGTFELTYAAKTLQNTHNFDAIIVLGCVIQGDTPHFDYVCQGVTQGITKLNTKTGKSKMAPVIFGVLTTNTLEQAEERAGGKHGNKGIESAITAIKMANFFCN
jgi:6,7-dimethyl-8-ribityllumazine synthase